MSRRIVLFGAFDRHNLGDLLFPHVVAALLRARGIVDEMVFAGLFARDLRACGGHEVRALAPLMAEPDPQPVTLIHVGGEVLSCDAWRAAVMLLPSDDVQATVAHLERRPAERRAWEQRMLGVDARAPYTAARAQWPAIDRVIYNAVGGVDLDRCDAALRDEVLGRLRSADAVGVRDRRTQALLQAAGIDAMLLPDPAVLVVELFGARIREYAQRGEPAHVGQRFPQGYLAVQFSADFGDDRSLDAIAAQLDAVAARTGLGLALFRAGAAPWHDDLDTFHRLAARLRTAAAHVFESLDLWDLCALVAASRGYCGSSLHGRIVALACGLPRVNLRSPVAAGEPSKQQAFADTWDAAPLPTTVAIDGLADGVQKGQEVDRALLARRAADLAGAYRRGFDALCAGLTGQT
jgi:hypothetical protein